MSWLWLGHFLILKMNDVLNLLFNEYNSFFITCLLYSTTSKSWKNIYEHTFIIVLYW